MGAATLPISPIRILVPHTLLKSWLRSCVESPYIHIERFRASTNSYILAVDVKIQSSVSYFTKNNQAPLHVEDIKNINEQAIIKAQKTKNVQKEETQE